MRTIVIRTGIIMVAVSLQASFLNLVFSKNLTIDLLPLIVLAWVTIVGFEKIWPWVVTLGILADLIAFEKVGINAIFFIGIAYIISFFSRRFLIEKKTAGFVVIVAFIVIVFLFLDVGRILVVENFSLSNSYIIIKENLFSWKRIINQNIVNILCFYVIYFPLSKMEKNIENYENKISIIS
jgi:rod shape-determining protein MreD